MARSIIEDPGEWGGRDAFGELQREMARQMAQASEAQAAALNVGLVNTAAFTQNALTEEMIRHQVEVLRAQQQGTFRNYAAQQQASLASTIGNLGALGLGGMIHWPNVAGALGLAPDIVGGLPKLPDPAAVTRARGLLRRLLSADQWREFEREGRITERIGDRHFVIRPGGMIEVQTPRPTIRGHAYGGSRIERWCVNPDAVDGDARLPPEDMAIAQLLHLRADPTALRNMANVFRP